MDTIHWLTLYLVPGLGPVGCRRLVEAFGSPESVLKANRNDLRQVKGLKKNVIEDILNRPPIKLAEQELRLAGEKGVAIVRWDDEAYPEMLRNIYNPPMVLYVKGDNSCLNRAAIAVVGSRAATTYGLKIAGQMAGELAAAGLTIISGLALGIDSAAHIGALEKDGITIAVLGCGVDVQYPRRNWRLAEKIAENGAVISEYPFGTQPEAFRFPARNRIISGLGYGVLVVEAAARSGSLITARLALEEGREVFAIPGRVDSSKSAGAHRLVQQGAKLVHKVDDILEELPLQLVDGSAGDGFDRPARRQSHSLTPDELKILAVLDSYPRNIESIISLSGCSVQKVNEILLLLELKGLLEALPGQQYRKNE